MEFVKPLDPYTLLPVDEPWRNRASGIKGSAVRHEAFTGAMSEIVEVITRAGLVPNGADLSQLWQALQRLQMNRFCVAAGTANALTITPTVAPAAYAAGQYWLVKAASRNAGALTLNVSGLGAKALLRHDGSPSKGGDLVPGEVILVVYDGVQFVRVGRIPVVPAQVAYFYVSSAGDDLADGSLANPLKTIGEAVSRVYPGQQGFIYLLSNLLITERVVADNAMITLLGYNDVQRTVTFAAQSTTGGQTDWPGGFTFKNKQAYFACKTVELVLPAATTPNTGIIHFWRGGDVRVEDSAVSAAGSANTQLISTLGRGLVEAYFAGHTLNAGVPGKLFAGVAAGADPNAAAGGKSYFSNLTSA